MEVFKCLFAFLLLTYCGIASAQPSKKSGKLTVLKDAPAEVLFRKYEELNLTCTVEVGIDNVLAYFWFKDGEAIEWNTHKDVETNLIPNVYSISSATEQTEGRYKCMAVTSSGEASQREYSVKLTHLTFEKQTLLKHKPVEGSPFKLDCPVPVEAYPKPTIKWVSQSTSGSKTSTPIQDPRKTVSLDGTLWFSNVTAEDAGEKFKYVCIAESPAVDDPVILAEHIIEGVEKNKEKYDGQLVPQFLSQDMFAKVGDDIVIYCIFGGTPLAYPDWYKDGMSVNNNPGDRVTRHNISGGKRLLISKTVKEDAGYYTCSASSAEKRVNHTVQLKVFDAPEIIVKPEQVIPAKQGRDLTIPCKVTGTPTPNITWTHNGAVLESYSRLEIKGSEVLLKDVTRNDKGYYGCGAVNEYGNAYAETLLEVVES